MLDLYDRLCLEGGAELFGSAIMGGGLVLANRPEVELDEAVVVIYYEPDKPAFSLRYRHKTVHPKQVEACAPANI